MVPDYPIYLFETGKVAGAPPWPALVEAVTCPQCQAPPMSRCYDMTNTSGTFGLTPSFRVDWHAKRKYAAIDAWRAQEANLMESDATNVNMEESDATEKGKVEEGNLGEHPGDDPLGTPAGSGGSGSDEEGGEGKEEVIAPPKSDEGSND